MRLIFHGQAVLAPCICLKSDRAKNNVVFIVKQYVAVLFGAVNVQNDVVKDDIEHTSGAQDKINPLTFFTKKI